MDVPLQRHRSSAGAHRSLYTNAVRCAWGLCGVLSFSIPRSVSFMNAQCMTWKRHESKDSRQQERHDIFIVRKNISIFLRFHSTLENNTKLYSDRGFTATVRPGLVPCYQCSAILEEVLVRSILITGYLNA